MVGYTIILVDIRVIFYDVHSAISAVKCVING